MNFFIIKSVNNSLQIIETNIYIHIYIEFMYNLGNLNDLPLYTFDPRRFLDSVHGVNCENVVGFVAIPVGLVGPLPLVYIYIYLSFYYFL